MDTTTQSTIDEMKTLAMLIKAEQHYGSLTFAFMRFTGIFESLSPLVLALTVGASSSQIVRFNNMAYTLRDHINHPSNTQESSRDLLDVLLEGHNQFATLFGVSNSLSTELQSLLTTLDKNNLLLHVYSLVSNNRSIEHIKKLLNAHHIFNDQQTPPEINALCKALAGRIHTQQDKITNPTFRHHLQYYSDLYSLLELDDSFSFRITRTLTSLPETIYSLNPNDVLTRMVSTAQAIGQHAQLPSPLPTGNR